MAIVASSITSAFARSSETRDRLEDSKQVKTADAIGQTIVSERRGHETNRAWQV
jgi:hypothetical protein